MNNGKNSCIIDGERLVYLAITYNMIHNVVAPQKQTNVDIAVDFKDSFMIRFILLQINHQNNENLQFLRVLLVS